MPIATTARVCLRSLIVLAGAICVAVWLGTPQTQAAVSSGKEARGSAEPAGKDAMDLPNFWGDPEFVRRFMGSYGVNSDIEPRMGGEETEFYRDTLLPLLRADDKDGKAKTGEEAERDKRRAIQELSRRIKRDSNSSALLSFILGNLYLEQRDNTNAIENYEIAVAKFPDFRRALKNLGLLQMQIGQQTEAVKNLTRVIQLGGGDSYIFGSLGYAYLSGNKPLAAEAAFQNAALYEPDKLDWKLGLIKALVAQEKHQQAVAALDDLLGADPAEPRWWELQAGVFLQMGRYTNAAVNFEMLRRMQQAKVKNLMLLGDIYMNEDLPEMALPVYLEAVEKAPGANVAGALRAAEILTSRGAFEGARALFAKVREVHDGTLTPEEELKLLKLETRVAWAEGRTEEAMGTLERIIRQDPTDGEALIMLGDFLAKTGEPERAAFQFEMASKISGHEAEAFVKHAQLLVQQQNYSEAIELLQKAQQIRPRDHVARYLEKVEEVARSRRG